MRNHKEWGDKIVFWGPMGCCTGNYFLMKGDLESRDIVELMRKPSVLSGISREKFPGVAAKDCGNYLLHNLPMAKYEAAKYLSEVLDVIEGEEFDISNIMKIGIIVVLMALLTACGRIKTRRGRLAWYFTAALFRGEIAGDYVKVNVMIPPGGESGGE